MLHAMPRALSRWLAMASALLVMTLLSAQGLATPRILASTNATTYPYAHQLDEYGLDGALLQQRTLPASLGSNPRDVVQLWGDSLGIFQGTFSARIQTLEAGAWRAFDVPGLSVANNTSFGGIAYADGVVYAGDMFTYGGGEAKGVVRLDLRTGRHTRWLADRDYEDLVMGLDGKLYGLRDMYGNVDVIDPATMGIVRTRYLGHTSSSRALAVDADGTLYLASWDRYVARFDAGDVERARLSLGGPLMDLDLDRDGHLVAGDAYGRVYVTNVQLGSAFAFDVPQGGNSGVFVAFVRATPTALAIAATGNQVRLSWRDGEATVDIYRNGERVHRGTNTGAFQETLPWRPRAPHRARYVVCNAGTRECSRPGALALPTVRAPAPSFRGRGN